MARSPHPFAHRPTLLTRLNRGQEASPIATASGPPPPEEAVAELRRAVRIRNQWTLRDKLFPLSHGRGLGWWDMFYAESLWASGTLVVGGLSFVAVTADPIQGLGFVFTEALLMSPILLLWAAAGAYFMRRRGA